MSRGGSEPSGTALDGICKIQAFLSSYAYAPNPKKSVRNDPGTLLTHKDRKSPGKRLLDSSDDEDVQKTDVTPHFTAFSEDPSSSPRKKRIRGYAAPEVYAHLGGLPDILMEGLDIVFCGINPGQESARIGHHFGHPTNHFWYCLHTSGLTSERLPPQEDYTLPKRFSLGLTNLVDRTTAEQRELSTNEQAAGVPIILAKVAQFRPRILCFIGLGIAQIFQRVLGLRSAQGTKIQKCKVGLQVYKMVYTDPDNHATGIRETLFYALPSTSGRVVSPQKSEKALMFTDLKHFVEKLKTTNIDTDEMHIIAPP